MLYQLVFGKVVTRKLHLHIRLGTGIMAKEVFTEEPMDVRKIAASMPRTRPRNFSCRYIVERASKELL